MYKIPGVTAVSLCEITRRQWGLPFCFVRVFKKSSPNCKLTVYLGKRDFVDHLDKVDPVDGVVLVDPDYLKDRKGFRPKSRSWRGGRKKKEFDGLACGVDFEIRAF
ncbi:beta-arrestin-2-like [Cricetulus griseus]|uniref:beta-arrestin-2-like n=1 Tax=Cricetulus griseus TaxID=10029 RepID=UPI0015C2F86F|nr:beta-arrestin-2-like [Cricetulus griseus]